MKLTLTYRRPTAIEAFDALATRILVDLRVIPDVARGPGRHGNGAHSAMAEACGLHRSAYSRWSRGTPITEPVLRGAIAAWEAKGYPALEVVLNAEGRDAYATATMDVELIAGPDGDPGAITVPAGESLSGLLVRPALERVTLLRHQWLDLLHEERAGQDRASVVAFVEGLLGG